MSSGVCLRCGAVGPVDEDHPDGRFEDVPLVGGVVDLLCSSGCHVAKGRIDRGAKVEAGPPTLVVVLGRRAAWLEFLASTGEPILMPVQVLQDFARVLAYMSSRLPGDAADADQVRSVLRHCVTWLELQASTGQAALIPVTVLQDFAMILGDLTRRVPVDPAFGEGP